MTFFYKFGKKARVYYTLSISRGGPGPRPPPGFATDYCIICLWTIHKDYLIKLKVLEKCTKNLIGHSRLAFNNHESNIDC